MSGLLRKAICPCFFLSFLLFFFLLQFVFFTCRTHKQEECMSWWLCLVLHFASFSERGCYFWHSPRKTSVGMKNSKASPANQMPSSHHAVLRDAVSRGTQHLFPLGPIIATSRHQNTRAGMNTVRALRASHADDSTTHLPPFELWRKENVWLTGEWNAITKPLMVEAHRAATTDLRIFWRTQMEMKAV